MAEMALRLWDGGPRQSVPLFVFVACVPCACPSNFLCFSRVVRCSRLSRRCARNPSCRNGGKALHSVPYALMCWTPLFEREIAKFTIAEFKTFSEEKDIWWAPVSSARGVLMNVQARETGALSVGEDGVEIHSPVQFKR